MLLFATLFRQTKKDLKMSKMPDGIQKLLIKGLDFLAKGKHSKAIEKFEKAAKSKAVNLKNNIKIISNRLRENSDNDYKKKELI